MLILEMSTVNAPRGRCAGRERGSLGVECVDPGIDLPGADLLSRVGSLVLGSSTCGGELGGILMYYSTKRKRMETS